MIEDGSQCDNFVLNVMGARTNTAPPCERLQAPGLPALPRCRNTRSNGYPLMHRHGPVAKAMEQQDCETPPAAPVAAPGADLTPNVS